MAIRQIEKATLGEQDPALGAMNRSEFDGRHVDTALLVQELQTPPFFASNKLVIVTNAPFFTPRKGQAQESDDATEEETEEEPKDSAAVAQLTEVLKNSHPGTLVVFQATSVNMRQSLASLIKKRGAVYNFSSEKRADALQDAQIILKDEIKTQGVSIPAIAQQRIIALVGVDEKTPFVRRLRGEVAKLTAYKGYGGAVSLSDVDALVSRSAEAKVWDVTDALSRRDGAKALLHLQQIWQDGEEPLMILSVLAKHLRQLLLAKELLCAGFAPMDAAARLGGHPYVAKKVVDSAASFDIPELKAQLHRCLEIDTATKSGRGDIVLAIEMLLIDACQI